MRTYLVCYRRLVAKHAIPSKKVGEVF